MIQYATIEDFDFIFWRAIKEAADKKFAPNSLFPESICGPELDTTPYILT